MAEESGQDKTEEPTAKRLQDAREKGQVARSRELVTAAMLLTAATMFVVFGDSIIRRLSNIMRSGLSVSPTALRAPDSGFALLEIALIDALYMLSPLFIVFVIVAVFSSVALGGWNFSAQGFSPKWNKLDPIAGIKRMFSARSLNELIKAILKVGLIAATCVLTLRMMAASLMSLGTQDVEVALAAAAHDMAWALLACSSATLVIALIDYPFQWWEFNRQLKMTKQEVRDEYKQTEGSPELKARVRSAQREIARRRMMEAVPKADVVITNPTHFAVALRYDGDKMKAPKIVAKGADLVASQIRQIARHSKVPLLSSPVLARALYYTTKLDGEVPAGLYVAVAQVLAYIYRLKRHGNWNKDELLSMTDLPIPDEYIRRSHGPRQPG